MKDIKLEIETKLQISRKPQEVFEAIIDPQKMSLYFIERSTGKIEEGKKLIWKFPEFDLEFPVRIDKVTRDKYISWYWSADTHDTLVEISLTPAGESSTLVTVTERSMENNLAGLKWLKGNTAGWANFLACLKAYLEFGINLRKGAFDFMAEKK